MDNRKPWSVGPSFAEKLQGINNNEAGTGNSADKEVMIDASLQDEDQRGSRSDKEETNEVVMRDGDLLPNDSKSKTSHVWKIVQKPWWPKKVGKEKSASTLRQVDDGSRFGVMAEEGEVVEGDKLAVTVPPVQFCDETDVGLRISSSMSGSKGRKGGTKKKFGSVLKLAVEGSEKGSGRQVLRKEKRSREEVQKVAKSFEVLRLTFVQSKKVEDYLDESQIVVTSEGSNASLLANDPQVKEDFHPLQLDLGEEGKLVGLGIRFQTSQWWRVGRVLWFRTLLSQKPNSPKFYQAFKSKPNFIVLAEIECEKEDQFWCLEKLGYDESAVIPSVRRSGGLVAAWKSSCVAVTMICKDGQYLHFRCSWVSRNSFFLTVVYAISYFPFKEVLWCDLNSLAVNLAGDFNDILLESERLDGSGVDFSRLRKF
ncbi:hypothetical protein K1719_015099 [Acacia pycnantha]|nr:hypothetical protein K1719_015099 [Acacia pycnantha]